MPYFRQARRDVGEAAIVSALRRVGARVWPISAGGIPDLLVGFRGAWHFLEIKSPLGPEGGASRDGQHLQPKQLAFFQDAEMVGAPAHVVRDPEEALAAIGIEFK